MNTLLIGIGQAGSTISEKISELLKNYNPEINEDIYPNKFINLNSCSCKCFLIDSEEKVINQMILNSKDNKTNNNMSKYFSKHSNIITNNSGRGSNWALGYSIKYKEYKTDTNINLSAFEKIEKFLEKCDFITKIIIIHSLNGGTGSGVGTRIIELIKNKYKKIKIISCPIFGFSLEKTTLSHFNTFFTLGHIYENVDNIIRLDNESTFNGKDFLFNDELYSKTIFNYIIANKKNELSIDKYYQNNKFIEIGGIFNEYINNVNDITENRISKKLFINKGNKILTCDMIFKTNQQFNKDYKIIFEGLCKNSEIKLNEINNKNIFLKQYNEIYMIDKTLKNNKIDIGVLYKSNKLNWMDDMLDKISTYIQYG